MWLDTEGKRIQAHGGSIFCENDTYYWYGENKEKTDGVSDIWHWGVRMYASHDLYNWEDLGVIIPPDLEDETSPLHPTSQMDRPHILYNRDTKKYVCWLKIMQKDGSNAKILPLLTWMSDQLETGRHLSDVVRDAALRAHFCEEMADVFMYLTDVLLCCGVQADEFEAAYREKMERNLKRDFPGEHQNYLKE